MTQPAERALEVEQVVEAEVWPGRGAYIFPGQGSQKPEMGQELFLHSPAARTIFKQADEVMGLPLSDVCFTQSSQDLSRTDIGQAAIGTVSIAAY